MLDLLTQSAGQVLSLTTAGTVLTTSFQGGAALALQGCQFLEAVVFAGFDAATDKTTIDFQVQVSDDNSTWMALETNDITLGTGATTPTATHSLAASAGNTVTGRLQATGPIQAKYVRVAAKYTGGTAPKAGDSAKSNVNYDAN